MRIIGAGVGRTGTFSLKLALETLLGRSCYHMADVFDRTQDVEFWRAAADGVPVDWQSFFAGFGATIDWPSAALWRSQWESFPDALVLLSERPAEDWWKSASNTIFPRIQAAEGPWREMMDRLLSSHFTAAIGDKAAAIEAYDRHNDDVVARVPSEQLIRWRPGDGWEPLCTALGIETPDVPFPHTNTTAQFRGNQRM